MKFIFVLYFSGNYGNSGNISGDYRGPVNTGPPSSQQNYGNNYSGSNTLHSHPPPQQPYYGQPPQIPPPQQQMYHQPMANTYQQMGQIPRPMNTPQPLDNRGYGQPQQQQQIPIQNRS